MSAKRVGKFIVIEGLDGAGTTTQTELLATAVRARGDKAVTTAEPTGGPIGSLIRQMLSKRVVQPDGAAIEREALALLFAADRIDHVSSLIDPSTERGAWVVSDRYYHSSFVYQGDVDDADHFDIDWIRTINARSRAPDLTLFLEVPTEVALGRIGERAHRDIYETREKLERLERRYVEVMSIVGESEPVVTIDGTGSIDDIAAEIWTHVEAL